MVIKGTFGVLRKLRNFVVSRGSVPQPAPMAVVYTPGKDGGTSATNALRNAGLECHHFHRLSPAVLKREMRNALDRDMLPPAFIANAAGLRPTLIEGRRDVRYIAMVRDQLERTLAALFQTMHRRQDGLTPDNSPAEIFETWLNHTNHTHGLDWFDHEYRDQLGIDVLNLPFDKAKRFQHYPEHKLLVLRMDCSADVKNAAISAHVGRNVRLGHANVGSQKGYATAYSAVKDMAWATDSLIDAVYGSRHMRHFWTEAELDVMRAKWRAKQPG